MKNPSLYPVGADKLDSSNLSHDPPTTFSYTISQNPSFNSSVIPEGNLFLPENTGLNLGWLSD